MKFSDVIKQAKQGRIEQEEHYLKVRKERQEELHRIVAKGDLELDGRRSRARKAKKAQTN